MADRFVTTNIRLPVDLYRRLKRRSAEEGTGLGEMIREAVTEYMAAKEPQVSPEDWGNDPFFAVIGTARSGLRDGAERHDDYLYRPRRRRTPPAEGAAEGAAKGPAEQDEQGT